MTTIKNVTKPYIENGKKQEDECNLFLFKKKRLLGIVIGEKVLCCCSEVVTFEEVIVCKIQGIVVAILPKTEFAYALSTKLFEE
jgi:hypothetical protein